MEPGHLITQGKIITTFFFFISVIFSRESKLSTPRLSSTFVHIVTPQNEVISHNNKEYTSRHMLA